MVHEPTTLRWNRQQSLGVLSNRLYEPLSTQDVYETFDGSVYEQDSSERRFGDLHWDDGMPYNQRDVYSSMTCPKNTSSKGWQHSIRRNLSMNGVSLFPWLIQECSLTIISRHSRRLIRLLLVMNLKRGLSRYLNPLLLRTVLRVRVTNAPRKSQRGSEYSQERPGSSSWTQTDLPLPKG